MRKRDGPWRLNDDVIVSWMALSQADVALTPQGIQQAKSDSCALRNLADSLWAIVNVEGRQAQFVFHGEDDQIDSGSLLKTLKFSCVRQSPGERRFGYDSSSKQLHLLH